MRHPFLFFSPRSQYSACLPARTPLPQPRPMQPSAENQDTADRTADPAAGGPTGGLRLPDLGSQRILARRRAASRQRSASQANPAPGVLDCGGHRACNSATRRDRFQRVRLRRPRRRNAQRHGRDPGHHQRRRGFGGGVAHLPENGTYLTGGGLNVLGHQYDGVTLRVDGRVTIPGPTAQPPWSTPEQCGTAEHVKGSGGMFFFCFFFMCDETNVRTRASRWPRCSLPPFLPPSFLIVYPRNVSAWQSVYPRTPSGVDPGPHAGIPRSLCSVLLVMNVDMFTLSGHGSFTGFLFDEHSGTSSFRNIFIVCVLC